MPGFAVQNTGASRLVMSSLVVTGKDAAGATVFTEELGRQFVLAGLKKRFKTKIPIKDCARLASLSVLGKLQTTGSLTLSAPVPAGACRP
jgi:hypothetical protein